MTTSRPKLIDPRPKLIDPRTELIDPRTKLVRSRRWLAGGRGDLIRARSQADRLARLAERAATVFDRPTTDFDMAESVSDTLPNRFSSSVGRTAASMTHVDRRSRGLQPQSKLLSESTTIRPARPIRMLATSGIPKLSKRIMPALPRMLQGTIPVAGVVLRAVGACPDASVRPAPCSRLATA